VVLKFRSVRSIVIAPARTGRERSNSPAVTKIDQTNSGNDSNGRQRGRMFKMVQIKLIAPKMDETPAR
jgi:hypothetical protein